MYIYTHREIYTYASLPPKLRKRSSGREAAQAAPRRPSKFKDVYTTTTATNNTTTTTTATATTTNNNNNLLIIRILILTAIEFLEFKDVVVEDVVFDYIGFYQQQQQQRRNLPQYVVT